MTDIGSLTIVELATVIEGLGTALAAVLGLVGIAMIYVQIRGQRAIQREATAMSLFRDYLQLALQRPELVNPDHARPGHAEWSIQYELFVANMLYSFDEVLQNTRSHDWREVVRGEVARHTDYLRSAEFRSKRRYYAPEIIALIDTVCADGASNTPRSSSGGAGR